MSIVMPGSRQRRTAQQFAAQRQRSAALVTCRQTTCLSKRNAKERYISDAMSRTARLLELRAPGWSFALVGQAPMSERLYVKSTNPCPVFDALIPRLYDLARVSACFWCAHVCCMCTRVCRARSSKCACACPCTCACVRARALARRTRAAHSSCVCCIRARVSRALV